MVKSKRLTNTIIKNRLLFTHYYSRNKNDKIPDRIESKVKIRSLGLELYKEKAINRALANKMAKLVWKGTRQTLENTYNNSQQIKHNWKTGNGLAHWNRGSSPSLVNTGMTYETCADSLLLYYNRLFNSRQLLGYRAHHFELFSWIVLCSAATLYSSFDGLYIAIQFCWIIALQ